MAWRRRWLHTRAPRMAARWPVILCWSVAALAGLGGLVGLLYLIGHGSPFGYPRGLEQIATAVTKKGPALALALLLAIELAWAVRRLKFEWLAWRPGPIHVTEFSLGSTSDGVDDGKSPNVDALCSTFRRRLAELRLQAPTSLPGAVPQGNFLDVLGAGGVDSKNVLGSLLNFLRASLPTHAYEINGVLVERKDPKGRGVTVQVVCLPNRSRPPVTVWDTTWEGAVRRAADAATAALLPTTRLCREQWAAWRRFAMPAGLQEAYEQGATLEQARRYDEALEQYFEAGRLDPMNLSIRLQVGKLQEKLGLYLDAFSTYRGILAVAQPGGSRVPWRYYRREAKRQRQQAILVARYRTVVLMGSAELAEQWRRRPRPEPTRRDERREVLKNGLVEQLRSDLERARKRSPRPGLKEHRPTNRWHVSRSRQIARVGNAPVGTLLGEEHVTLPGGEHEAYLELRELLALAALDAARRVQVRARVTRKAALAASSVKLTQLCIEERLAWIQGELGSEDADWPPDSTTLASAIKDIEGATSFRTWHEHYNAACAFAIPLLVSALDADLRDRLAKCAVVRLQEAMGCADGAYIATRRDWLVGEDPDLNGLRSNRAFKCFEAMYFPAPTPAPLRPRNVQRLESSRHVQALLIATADRWRKVWRQRGQTLGRRTDVHSVIRWWRDELEAWRPPRSVAVEYRDWDTRMRLVTSMARSGECYDFEPLSVPSPRYEEQPLESRLTVDEARDEAIAAANRLDAACDEAIAAANRRLEALVEALPEPAAEPGGPQILRDIESWQARLENIGVLGEEPGRYFLAHLCDCHAALWQLLGQWLASPTPTDGSEPSADDAERKFRQQVARTHRLWCTAYDWWRPGNVMLALASRKHRNGGVPPFEVLRWQMSEWREARGSRAHSDN